MINRTAIALCAALASWIPTYADAKTCAVYSQSPYSVPKDYMPPNWASWATTPPTVNDTSLDDPRWNGAAADSYSYGSSSAPLHVRTMWKDDYLYLSFISDLTVDPGASTPRDVFVGFRRVTPITTAPKAYGYIFQIHLQNNTGAELKAGAVPFCTKWDTSYACGDTGGKPIYWRVFADAGTTSSCSGGIQNKRQFQQIAAPTWVNGNIHAWQLDDGRWAVQMRVKLAAAGSTSLNDGIEKGSQWWYEATISANPSNLVSLGKLPASAGTFCRNQVDFADEIVHETLKGDDASTWGELSLLAPGASPTGCDNGLYIDRGHLGAVFDTAGPYDNVALTTDIKALRANGTAAANTIIAQVVNGTGAAFSGKLQARFKLADWGATIQNLGDWITIPADSGTTNPAIRDIPSSSPLANGARAAVSFNWTLKEEDYCKYQLTIPNYRCDTCTCPMADPEGNGCRQFAKLRANGTVEKTGPCLMNKTRFHQCLQVELTTPNNAVKISQSGAFTNLDFKEMSVYQGEATIDIKGAPGNGAHEVILLTIPRNLPAPTNKVTSGLELLANNSLRLARAITDSHAKSITSMKEKDLKNRMGTRTALTAKTLARDDNKVLAALGSKSIVELDKKRIKLPDRDYEITGDLLRVAGEAVSSRQATNKPAASLTRRLVSSIGPGLAAKVVPVIEVYPFYKPARGNIYLPMTAFAVFLSHEGATTGFTVSDLAGPGITKLSTNIYKLTVPAGRTKAHVTLHAESVDPPAPQPIHPHVPPGTPPPTPPPHTPVPIKPFSPNWKLKWKN